MVKKSLMVQNRREKSFIHRVSKMVEDNMKNEGFGVSELAARMNMSRSNLHRKIKSATGITVSQVIRNARLDRALKLLQEDSLTVAEAAYMTGFRDAAYFSRCFKNHFGYPPVEVKELELEGNEIETQLGSGDNQISGSQLNGFPTQTTSFVGRKKEIETIIGLIEEHRIVTLTGTGGCGKTRLACEVAKYLGKLFDDGIWFVDLANIETEELVSKQVMAAFELSEIPGKDRLDIVAERIQKDRLLIVLDNCEHLISTCTEVAHSLIASAPGLSLLLTSREALNLQGESVWSIPSLSLPDPSAGIDMAVAVNSEAVNLFTERARLSNQGFELVDDNVSTVSTICQLIDGIPLAIELVASRIRYMDTLTLLDRLSERFDSLPSPDPGTAERHRTMQAAIEWSYKLLSEKEKTLFRRLSVFSGGFNLVAVEEVCASKYMPADEMLDLLSKLVEKSMIQTVYQPAKEMRYRLLEPLKRYVSKLLVEKGENIEARKMHLVYYTGIAEQAYREQFESLNLWLPRLMLEHDNLISALNWAEQNSPEGFRLMAGYLAWYWVMASNLSSGKQYLENALSLGPDKSEAYARNLHGLAYLTFYFKDIETVFSLFNESRSLWQQLKNRFEESYVLSLMSLSCNTLKDYKKGFNYSKQSLNLARELGNPGLIVNALVYFCIAMVHSRQFTEALPYVEELMTSSEKLNHALGISGAHHLRSDCALGLKDFPEAEKSYALAAQTAAKYGITFNSYADLQGVAFALSGQGRCAKSLRINAAAIEGFKSIGVEIYGIWPMWDEFIDTYIGGARKEVGEELVKQYEEEGIAMGFDAAMEYALDFSKD